MRMEISTHIIDQLENIEEKKIDLPVINNTELRWKEEILNRYISINLKSF